MTRRCCWSLHGCDGRTSTGRSPRGSCSHDTTSRSSRSGRSPADAAIHSVRSNFTGKPRLRPGLQGLRASHREAEFCCWECSRQSAALLRLIERSAHFEGAKPSSGSVDDLQRAISSPPREMSQSWMTNGRRETVGRSDCVSYGRNFWKVSLRGTPAASSSEGLSRQLGYRILSTIQTICLPDCTLVV